MSLVNEKIITKTSWNNTILEDNITSNVTDNLSQNLENISDSLSTYNYSNILKINEPDLVNFMELGDDNLLN
jgi:hypothetical protein